MVGFIRTALGFFVTCFLLIILKKQWGQGVHQSIHRALTTAPRPMKTTRPMAFIRVHSSCCFRDGFVHLCGRLPRGVAVATCIEAHFAAHDDVTSLGRIPLAKEHRPVGHVQKFRMFRQGFKHGRIKVFEETGVFQDVHHPLRSEGITFGLLDGERILVDGRQLCSQRCLQSVCAEAGSMIRFAGTLLYHNDIQ